MGLARGPGSQSSPLKNEAHPEFSWLESFYGNSGSTLSTCVGGQFIAVSKAARKRFRFSLSHAHSMITWINWRLIFFSHLAKLEHMRKSSKWKKKKKSVTKSAKKNNLQVAGWQTALFQVPNQEGPTRWHPPGCSSKWDALKSKVLVLWSDFL